MKSDSGGEMESCRSSDSGLERELAEKEREIASRDEEITRCHRDIAERETDMVRKLGLVFLHRKRVNDYTIRNSMYILSPFF